VYSKDSSIDFISLFIFFSENMWYDRFMVGFHKRVGDLLVQDTATSIEVRHAVQNLLELD
jgi:hypothetical protein